MRKATKVEPGSDLHMSLLMSQWHLNLVVGDDQARLLAYGRAAYQAGREAARKEAAQHPTSAPDSSVERDAARWRYVRQFMTLDDVGDADYCLGLVLYAESLTESVDPHAGRLDREREAKRYENAGPDSGPINLPEITVEQVIDAAIAAKEKP